MAIPTSAKWLCAIAAAASLAGCSRTRIQEGYIVDEEMVTAIQPGVDNKQSVETMMGQPSFTSEFGGNEWYYVSRELRQIAFRTPKPSEQDIVRVTFDKNGTVVAVDEQKGLDRVSSISPEGDQTETIDGKPGFFEDLFNGVGGQSTQSTTGAGDPTRPD